MRQYSLPVEFAELSGKVDYINKVNHSEWSSSCPQCGGTIHQGGAFPDRFRMFTNASHGKNKIMGWCRKCSYTWFPDGDKKMNPDDFEKWRKEQIRVEEERKREAEHAIRLLQSEKLWEEYYKAHIPWSYEVLDSWGICKENVEFWKLGFIPEYKVYSGDNTYYSPAISIPIWGEEWSVKNIKVRVLNPQADHDRYRYIYKIQTHFPFVARPDLTQKDIALVVEGEKKAMVCAAVKQDIPVIGLPSVTPSEEALSEINKYKKIYLCLDPDSKIKNKNGQSPLGRAVKMIGREKIRLVNLPDKIDDMILQHGLDLVDALRYSKQL